MDLIETLQKNHIDRSVVTIGSFDGVHLGHQVLIRQLKNSAKQALAAPVVITFHPHPNVYFGRSVSGFLLSSESEKSRLIQSLGINHLITLPFNHTLANMEAGQFMQHLKDTIGLTGVLVGFNFALGKDRKGNVAELKHIGREIGFEVEVIKSFNTDGKTVSSSAIRKLLLDGKVQGANEMLGHRYSIDGEVVHGEHRGSKLGIPTANLSIPEERLIPGKGVYVTRAYSGGKRYDAVTNIGVRPTFANPLTIPRVEPHLLDTEDQLYGQQLTLEFIEYLRPELKFPDKQALIAQIKQDIQKAREVLANET